MKNSAAIALAVLGVASPVAADGILGSLLEQLTSLGQSAVEQLNSSDPQTNPPFDASQQHVDVTGVHAWQAPGPNDERGPCPGLNALANHGYLPRSGLSSIIDLTSGTTEVFGMGLDLAATLAAYGAVLDGAGAGWSIGGAFHTGISGSHNNYESDSSPMRADLNQCGSNVDVVMSQFQELLALQPDPATANYDIDVLSQFKQIRFNESIAKNPYFFYGPFTGPGVTSAAFSFIYRFMANHTAENPAGILNQDVLKSFFAISGEGNNLTWTPGYERIPDNWYKRAIGDAYGLTGLSYDITGFSQKYPFLSQPGCNTGKVNTYTPINATDTNGKDYDFSNPIDVICYGIVEASSLSSPTGVVADVVHEVLLPIQNALGCVTVPVDNSTVGATCPGYSLYGGPTGSVAPGAIQN